MKQQKCLKCETVIEEKALYCSECGEIVDPPEPKMSKWTAIWIILALIFIFPIGIIGAILAYWNLNNKKKEWREEKIIRRMELNRN